MPYLDADHAGIPEESGYGSAQLRETTSINSPPPLTVKEELYLFFRVFFEFLNLS